MDEHDIVIGQDTYTDEHFIAFGKKAYTLPYSCDAFILTFSSEEGIKAAKNKDIDKIKELMDMYEKYVQNHPNYEQLLKEIDKLVDKIPFPIVQVDLFEEYEVVG